VTAADFRDVPALLGLREGETLWVVRVVGA